MKLRFIITIGIIIGAALSSCSTVDSVSASATSDGSRITGGEVSVHLRAPKGYAK